MKESFCMSYTDSAPRDVLADAVDALTQFEYLSGRQDRKQALTQARFLIVVFSDMADFENKSVRDDWDYFMGELHWKRKQAGEVVLLTKSGLDFASLPLRLRGCTFFTFDELDQLGNYFLEQSLIRQTPPKHKAGMSAKQIVYTPRPDTLRKIEFSGRVPSIPSFDGKIKRIKNKQSGACKDDHIFSESEKVAPQKPTPFDPFDNESGIYLKTKKSKSGCAATFLVLFILLVIALVITMIIMLVTNAGSGSEVMSIVQETSFGLDANNPQNVHFTFLQ